MSNTLAEACLLRQSLGRLYYGYHRACDSVLPCQRRDQSEQARLPLAAAAELDGDAPLVWIDDRADYGEASKVALAAIGDVLFFIAFVDRDPARIIMGLSKPNRREVVYAV